MGVRSRPLPRNQLHRRLRRAASDQTPAETSPQPSTQAVRDASTATPAAEPPAAPAPAAETEAPPGAYWQVMAVQGKSDAAVVVRTLKNKGFPATVSPGTKGLTRVLVGPYPERTALGRAKTDLEAAGFNGLYRVEIGK